MGYEEAEPPPLPFVGFVGYLSRFCRYTFIALRTTKFRVPTKNTKRATRWAVCFRNHGVYGLIQL